MRHRELNFAANGLGIQGSGTPKEPQRGSKATSSCVWAVCIEVFAEKSLPRTQPQERPTGVINIKPQEPRGSAASRVQRPYSILITTSLEMMKASAMSCR